jgi:hypothetical protein
MNNLQQIRLSRISEKNASALNVEPMAIYLLSKKILEAKNTDQKIYAIKYLLEQLTDAKENNENI